VGNKSKITRVKCCQEQQSENLLHLPNVVATATGYRQRKGRFTRQVCIQVFVSRKYPPDRLSDLDKVPSKVTSPDGWAVRVDVIEVGGIGPLEDTARYRPVVGGCSIGSLLRVNRGTLGGWACDTMDDSIVFLTNNHVVTASDDLTAIPTPSGIVQPGQQHGGAAPADLIGHTKRIVALPTSAVASGAPISAVDAAAGTIEAGRSDDVLQVGPAIYELAPPSLGSLVQKRGCRTQKTTNGEVVSVNFTTPPIPYGTAAHPRYARIGNTAFMIASSDGQPFADDGDSGALVFSQTEGLLEGTFPVVGLLFAFGRDGAGMHLAFACDINTVFDSLSLTTLCNCYFRLLIERILMSIGGNAATGVSARAVQLKEEQLKRFRDHVLMSRPLGRLGVRLLHSQIAKLADTLFEDEETFGLLLRILRPWILLPNNLEILEARVDDDLSRGLELLGRKVLARHADLRGPVRLLIRAVHDARGRTVKQLLATPVSGRRGRG
jgi:hypothetical protein